MRGRNNERGRHAELSAQRYLEARGLRLLASNFRGRWGEIDLVMEAGTLLVFVEVRARSSGDFGGALASVTAAKQQRIVRTAAQFLEQRGLSHRPVRFDIVTIDGADGAPEWHVDAFRPVD